MYSIGSKKLHLLVAILSLTTICRSTIPLASGQRLTQDILRHPKQQPQPQQQAAPEQQLALPPNFQLPPQLAQLTPQQLQQLAQLRALQIQQQQQQQQQQLQANSGQTDSSALNGQQNSELNSFRAPGQSFALGAASSPTSEPQREHSSVNVSPTGTQSASVADQPDRHDHDGSYHEANTEQEGVNSSGDGNGSVGSSTADASSTGSATGSGAQPGPTFEVNWNKCPQLEPSETEKNKKTQVITKCLQSAPIPANLTRENVEAHREQIATCALKVEGWFDDMGNYRYDKAENEIRSKKLDGQIEIQVLKFHIACKEEASKKFPREQNKLIDQVQFYQACMDYYISIACEIEVSVDQ